MSKKLCELFKLAIVNLYAVGYKGYKVQFTMPLVQHSTVLSSAV